MSTVAIAVMCKTPIAGAVQDTAFAAITSRRMRVAVGLLHQRFVEHHSVDRQPGRYRAVCSLYAEGFRRSA